jgi:hypothetical protein
MKPKPNPKSNLTVTNNNINHLLSQKTITTRDIERLNQLERQHFQQIVNNKVEKLKGEEQDDFLNKIAPVISPISKSDIWERNHLMVSKAIADYMQRYGIMPTQNTIAQETGLSRQTVAKHIARYNSQPEYIEETERFKFMSHTLLANVFRFASNGDMRAARIYFEMVGSINKQQNDTVNTQNNYIQINNTILSQENLKHLTPEQLTQIEKIVTNKG